jgi:PUA domain protein
MVKKFRRFFLKEKEAKSFLKEASKKLTFDLSKIFNIKTNVEILETDFAKIFIINGKPLLLEIEKRIIPTLISNKIFRWIPKVIVDMGAVPHLCNGADIMAPGIVGFEGEFKEGDLVFIVDEKHKKPIAVGETLYNINAIKTISKGIVIRNTHFVGDKIWKNILRIF